MLVAIVIIFGRPACTTISASRACCFALSTLCGSLSFLSMPEISSEFSIEVVPTSAGWPRSWQSRMSLMIAWYFSRAVRKTWSMRSSRIIFWCVGMTTVSSP